MLVKPAAYPDSRLARIQWRDRAGISPASRASLRGQHYRFALALLLAAGTAACAMPHRSDVPAARRRIVALMPSFVEDLVAIGAGRQIVGVAAGTGNVAAVRYVERVADFASVDVERIVALHPDAVVAIPAQARFLGPLRRTGIAVVILPDATYDEIFSDLVRLGTLSGHESAARREIASLRAQTARIRAREPRTGSSPSVFVVLGAQPIWTVGDGSYIAALLALAGGRNAVGSLAGDYGEFSAEALLRLQPDAIVTDPSVQLNGVIGREPWRSLRAVREGHVFVIPDASLLERPGPRYVAGLAWLVKSFATLRR